MLMRIIVQLRNGHEITLSFDVSSSARLHLQKPEKKATVAVFLFHQNKQRRAKFEPQTTKLLGFHPLFRLADS